jgi:hypothetical protein
MPTIENLLRNIKATMANTHFLSKQKKSCCSGTINQISHSSLNKEALSHYTQTKSIRS